MNDKIGIAIITHNRMDFFKKVQESIPDYVNLYVVNTGNKYPSSIYQDRVKLHQCDKKTCVGWGKNHGLRMMMNDDCDHLFTMEDDVYIIDPNICKKYINAAYTTGIYHMNFGFSHKENLKPDGSPAIVNMVEYNDNVSIILTPNVLGAFTYYYRGVIKNIGYHDERFNANHMDHVELTYRTIKAGLHPPFWCFCDINKSWEMIGNLSNMGDDSIVRNDPEFKRVFHEACSWFKHKHGAFPMQLPRTSMNDVMKSLEDIEKKYAKPERRLVI